MKDHSFVKIVLIKDSWQPLSPLHCHLLPSIHCHLRHRFSPSVTITLSHSAIISYPLSPLHCHLRHHLSLSVTITLSPSAIIRLSPSASSFTLCHHYIVTFCHQYIVTFGIIFHPLPSIHCHVRRPLSQLSFTIFVTLRCCCWSC